MAEKVHYEVQYNGLVVATAKTLIKAMRKLEAYSPVCPVPAHVRLVRLSVTPDATYEKQFYPECLAEIELESAPVF